MPKPWVNLKELGMLVVNEFKETLLDCYYLDKDGLTIRYKKNGYYNRYKKDNIVATFKMNKLGILGVHVPKQRKTVPLAHLILLLNNICIPDNYVVDHIDGDVRNNHISNLRVVTQAINCRNRKRFNKQTKTNENGITKSKNSFIVRVTLNKVRHYIGSFKTLEEAINARNSYNEQRKLDGYTERHFK